MRRLLFFVTLSFFAGILTHAFVFPDFLSRTTNLESVRNRILGEKDSTAKQNSDFLTIVSFKEGAFHPSKVWIRKGNYLAIRNSDDKEQMWLASEIPAFKTVRGYGLSEEQKSVMDEIGTFSVYERNSQSQLIIVVQPN